MSEAAGLRELRQQASDYVKRAEAGETIVVTINGRAVAQLGPVARDRWRRWDDIAAIFAGPADQNWTRDRELIGQAARDPLAR
jgi:prevent-host-death family protein